MRQIAIAATAAAIVIPSLGARADDYFCPPSRGAVTLDGNVIVRGACTLNRTRVKGNVYVRYYGDLYGYMPHIDGNVQSDGAVRVRLDRAWVDGSVQLEHLRSLNLTFVRNGFVDGNIQLKENRSPLRILENFVDGDVQLFSNRGGASIYRNTIGGNLQCKSNYPAPVGGGNRVGGNKEDQCRNF